MNGPIVILAGGTGGHIFPGLAVAAELRRRNVDVLWVGALGGLEERLVPAHNLPIEFVRIRALRGGGVWRWLELPFVLLGAWWSAARILRRHRPRAVLSLGGYAAGPGGLAAFALGLPLVVHEQNRIPGLTNRVLARLARRVLAGYPDAFARARNAEYVGNPVRTDLIALQRRQPTVESATPRILVLGGSQGARALNLKLPQTLARISPRPQVWHQCGQRHKDETHARYRELGLEARVDPFIRDMQEAYGWADLVICRAGALTLAEVACAGLPAVLVPFPYAADDHQRANARFAAERGAALICDDHALDSDEFMSTLAALCADPERRAAMARASRELCQPDATQRVAERVLEVAA